MTEERKFLEAIAEILEMEVEEISLGTDFRSEVPNWDSLKGFSILVMVEEEYGKKISVDEFLKMDTLGEILQVSLGKEIVE